MSVINHYLLVYDRKKDELIECIEYGDKAEEALKAYGEKEMENWQNPHMDIVLVGSDSLDTVKITHSTYFENRVEKAKRTKEMFDQLIAQLASN